jgi:hypothetical protein
MPPRYQDFYLIVSGSPGAYTVEAQGPGQIRVGPVATACPESDALRADLQTVQAGLAPTPERMQALGGWLFEILFPRPVVRAFERAPEALPPGVDLRLKLVVRPPELGPLPWELIYDPDSRFFMAARLSYPIVRFVESGRPVASLLARRPLRVLYLQANPPGTLPLESGDGAATLRQALGAHGEVHPARATTPTLLRDLLRQQPGFHVLHYDGHAAFDPARGSGHLYLHAEEGQAYPLGGEQLAACLDGTTVRLVVLAACETARDSIQKRFSGIAGQLMHASSLPAVVAMQFGVPDASAQAFTREFYRALAADYPVDAATIEGRKAILAGLGGGAAAFAAPDWATPVLFMRSADGRIFEPAETTPPPAPDAAPPAPGGVSIQIGDVHGGQVRFGDVAGGDVIKDPSRRPGDEGP